MSNKSLSRQKLVILQKQIINPDNIISYEKLSAAADQITSGRAYLNILSLEEEKGRTTGGTRNVEASLLLAANERTNPKEQTAIKRTRQENLLKQYAEETDCWLPEYDFSESDMIAEGAEAKIYPSPKEGFIRKVVNYQRFSKTPFDYLNNRISLHNYLFPDTSYQLIGFTDTEDFMGNKTFAFVVEQPFVQGNYISHSNETKKFFEKEIGANGFELGAEDFKPLLKNKDYIIKDLHDENIMIDENNNILFIDSVPELNSENRQYGDNSLIPNNADNYNSSRNFAS